MRGKKIFGIGATLLMLTLVFTPAINGMQKSKEIDIINTKSVSYDLEITLDHIKAVKNIEVEDEEYINVLYEIKYKIKNVGEENYEGKPLVILRERNSVEALINWHTDKILNLVPGGYEVLIKKISVKSYPTYDFEDNIEAKYASNNLEIEVAIGGGADYSLDNNYDSYFSDCWNYYKNNQKPTFTQLLSYIPSERWIDHYEVIDDIRIPVFKDGYSGIIENIRSILKSNHLGWISEAAFHIAMISADIGLMISASATFIVTVSGPVSVVANWLEDIIVFYTSLSNGIFLPILFSDIVHDLIAEVIPAISKIISEAALYGGVMVKLAEQLEKHIDEYENWTITDPWDKPIKVFGECLNVENRETVKIYHDNKLMYSGEAENKRLRFEFDLQPGEKSKLIQNCRITAKYKDQTLKSKLIYSWVFSNGSFYWTFKFKDSGSRTRLDCLDMPLFERLINNNFFFLKNYYAKINEKI